MSWKTQNVINLCVIILDCLYCRHPVLVYYRVTLITSSKFVMFLVCFVLSVCEQDYGKSSGPIFMKPDGRKVAWAKEEPMKCWSGYPNYFSLLQTE